MASSTGQILNIHDLKQYGNEKDLFNFLRNIDITQLTNTIDSWINKSIIKNTYAETLIQQIKNERNILNVCKLIDTIIEFDHFSAKNKDLLQTDFRKYYFFCFGTRNALSIFINFNNIEFDTYYERRYDPNFNLL